MIEAAAPLVEKSGIKSVYDAEREAMKSGLIKPYSGRSRGRPYSLSKRKDQQIPNTDLQHFLIKHMKLEEPTDSM